MFIKYEKTFRIVVPDINIQGKFFLSKEQSKYLLGSNVVIEEKLDGANTGIIRHKKGFSLQKRGSLVGQSEHSQFQYFHHWANQLKYESLMKIPIGYLIYGELMYAKHTIFYNKLPDYFLVFDVLTNKKEWLNRNQRNEFCEEHNLYQAPLISEGSFTIKDLYKLIPKISNYGEESSEGIVIKKYNKNGYVRAKLVKEEFIKKFDEEDFHWTNHNIIKNELLKI